MLEFSIFPGQQRSWDPFFLVWIFSTDAWMQRRLQYELISPIRKLHEVWAHTERNERITREKPWLGRIYLPIKSCTDACVSHEILHATFLWANHIRLVPGNVLAWKNRTHERVAEAHGYMVSQFWKQFTAHEKREHCWGFEK